jgi:hypothetical protein
MEVPEIQALMPDELACSMQIIEGTHIIENLFNSLSHKVGALKRNGVRTQQMICNMAVFESLSRVEGQPQKCWMLIGNSCTR